MVTRGNDAQFADFVQWTLQPLIVAEAIGITQDRAQDFPTTNLFGLQCKRMFINAIGAIGNYGDLYDRHIEDRFPRSGMNLINTGTNGLLFSNPLGDLDSTNVPELSVQGSMLERIERRGIIVCGVLADRPWLGVYDDVFVGLDVEFCRAISAAIFNGNTNQLAVIRYESPQEGFKGLANGQADILASVACTMEIDVEEPSTGVGFSFSPPYFYDSNTTAAYSMATRQEDQQWSDFVRWYVWSTIYAEEEGIVSEAALNLPTVNIFGPNYVQMFRFINVALGNYGEIYERSQEAEYQGWDQTC